MKIPKKVLLLFISFLILLTTIAYGIPSGGTYPPEFTYKNGYWYDSWGFSRNYFSGEDGFLPNLAYESLGSDKELAFQIGQWFEENYENKIERAEAILDYVQQWTDYGYDEENVFRNGVPQEEWAWNADEMTHMFNETANLIAIGDCEDMSFLCTTLFIASKFDVALVDAPGHVALLIWLPEYDNANYYWDILNDGREYGWIWVEATGEVNPLGWTPPDFSDGDWSSHILGFSEFSFELWPKNPSEEDDVTVKATIISAISSIDSVVLNYSIENNFKEIKMINSGSAYEAEIPRQSHGTRVSGVIRVTDNDNFVSEQSFNYTVGQSFQFPPFLFEAGIFLFIIFLLILVFAR